MRLLKIKTFSSLLTILCFLVIFLALVYLASSNTVAPISQTPRESDLDFAMYLDKKSYERNEPIQATFQLKNIGTNPIIVKARLALNRSSAPEEDMDIYCEIMKDNKDPIRFAASVSVSRLRASHFIQLNGGETTEVVYYDLRDLYKIVDPGKYSIRAVYANTFDPENGQVAWKGKVVSDVVTFVIEP